MPSPRHARRSSLRSARRRAALAGACTVTLAGMLLTTPPSVAADGTAADLGGLAPTVVPVGAVTRDEALAAYDAVQDAMDVPAGWTGSVDGCRVGTESQGSTSATLSSLNALRSVVDAAPVRLDADLNRKALAAALIMKAQGALSHDPPSDWRCWSAEGREAAGSSNLFLGYSGARAMEGFVDDAGIDSLGHRRWLLDPRARVFGTGSTGSSNALWVFGPDDVAVPDRTAVAWPPAGHLAEPWLFQDWSLEIVEADLTGLDAARVSVTVDGRAAEVTRLRPLAQYFGPGTGLTWRVPAAADLPAGDHEVVVRVSGITVDGDSSPITWRTTVVDPDGVVPPPDPDPVVQPPAFADRPVVRRASGSSGPVRPGTRLVARWSAVRSDGETVVWTRDGRTLGGALGRSYVVRRADRGHALRAVVTATGEGGTTTRGSLALRVR